MRNWKKQTGRWSHQRGAGTAAWLAGAIALVSIVTLTLRLGPHYIDFRTLQAIMDSLPADEVHAMDNRSVRDLLQKRFLINNIRDMRVRDIMTFDRSKKGTQIIVTYEKREHILFNIDVVLTFTESYNYQ
ncbi:MAG: DUF4845 domain-containing protein [Gammaproteobacteria bacterium]|nr:DUF4845 domain-containing protein [Gammaproteobacteria bacterium]